MKAQAEFALILGVVVIAAFVGVYSYTTIKPPTVSQSAMNDEQKAVASFATDLVREAASNTVSQLYSNGGYLDGETPELGSVYHAAYGNVAYWQMCEKYSVPDMEEKVKKGIKDYISGRITGTESMGGKQIAFDKGALAVNVKVYDNRVAIAVNLPTVFDGASLEQPYQAEIYTKFGRIYGFSRNFAMMESQYRMLDSHLISSLTQSSEYSSCWIPFGTGNANRRFSASWEDLRDCMEQHVKYSLSNTQVGRETSITDDDEEKIADFTYGGWSGTGREFFFIPAINVYDDTGDVNDGDRYEDLHVSFMYGDGDGLDTTEFSGPGYIEIKPAVGAFSRFLFGFTVAEYAQTYSVKYPVIVSIWDDSTGESMNFATYVYMKDNTVGSGCTAPPAMDPVRQSASSGTYASRCKSGATAYASVAIRYDGGDPVANAPVSYAGCSLGLTDELGRASGYIPEEMFSALAVEADGNEYAECHGYQDMGGLTMTIPKSGDMKFVFMTVPVAKSGSTYTISPAVPSTGGEVVSVEMIRDADVCDDSTIITLNMDDEGGFTGEKVVRKVPLAKYDVGITAQKDGKVVGFIDAANFTLPSTGSVYVYVPSMAGFEQSSDIESEVENLKSLFSQCGIKAVAGTAQNTGVCTWTAG